MRRNTDPVLAIVSVALACAATMSCAHTRARAPKDALEDPPLFTYEGATGPAAWGKLAPEFAACETGKAQSPVELAGATVRDVRDVVFHYQPSGGTLGNDGHTVQLNVDPGSAVELDGVRYELAQIHFHHPAEHVLHGHRPPLEMHMVHKGPADAQAIVAVLFEEGAAARALSPLWSNLPQAGNQRRLDAQLSPEDLLPASRVSFRYDGSLTTPPCTEGVHWVVLDATLTVDKEQIAAFEALYPNNARPLQSLAGRRVVLDERAAP